MWVWLGNVFGSVNAQDGLDNFNDAVSITHQQGKQELLLQSQLSDLPVTVAVCVTQPVISGREVTIIKIDRLCQDSVIKAKKYLDMR